jgi:hypothetical protein
MPQLNLLREPTAANLVLGVGMPMGGAGRWSVTVGMADHDGRRCGDGVWSVSPNAEHADIGLVFKDAYDAWFNGDYWTVAPAVDRSLRYRL